MLFKPHTSNPANYRHIKRAGKKSSHSGILNGKKHILARSLGVISVSEDDLVDISEIETYPKNQICVISTGSQGEPRSSLNLSAQNSGKWLRIDENDVIIFSSRTIPGNEKRVARLVNNLVSLGASVVNDENLNTTHQDMGSAKNLVNSIRRPTRMVYSCARRVTPPSGTQGTRNRDRD
ncbi:MAG: hypothetical protein CM15mP49_27060 [Actinomycetota bacterium]|nr:MAG: hypothetical protein CM15mP49_27060 [Actinomycetota bacterium]